MNDFDTFRREAVAAVRVALQWFFLAVPMGLLCGFLGTLFHLAVEHATELRAAQPWLLFLLPVAGLLITALYKVTKCEGVGTNNVIRAVQSGEPVSILLVPAIFLGTVLTHLCGGSAGREGAALQMGGSIGWNLGTLLRLKDHDRRTATISGMAAFFSALFGTQLDDHPEHGHELFTGIELDDLFHQNHVTGGGDGQPLGNALHDTHQDCFNDLEKRNKSLLQHPVGCVVFSKAVPVYHTMSRCAYRL